MFFNDIHPISRYLKLLKVYHCFPRLHLRLLLCCIESKTFVFHSSLQEMHLLSELIHFSSTAILPSNFISFPDFISDICFFNSSISLKTFLNFSSVSFVFFSICSMQILLHLVLCSSIVVEVVVVEETVVVETVGDTRWSCGQLISKISLSFSMDLCVFAKKLMQILLRKSADFKAFKFVKKCLPTFFIMFLEKLISWSFELCWNRLPSSDDNLLLIDIRTISFGNCFRSSEVTEDKFVFCHSITFRFGKNVLIFPGVKSRFWLRMLKASTSKLDLNFKWFPVKLFKSVSLEKFLVEPLQA